MKLKERIKKWLFKDELIALTMLDNDIRHMQNQLDPTIQNYRAASLQLHNAKELYEECMETCRNLQVTINDVCDVGVDTALYEPYHNWAVVCIHGKTEFVKFIPLKQGDVQTVAKFLKQFEYTENRLRVDSPLGYKEYVAPWLAKERNW